MAGGVEAIEDFKKFASAELTRQKAQHKASNNEAASEWWADKDLKFTRDTMHNFFQKIKGATIGSNEMVAVVRCADTVAAFDRAYKIRRQGRLDNVPRQDMQSGMEELYWEEIPKQMTNLATL